MKIVKKVGKSSPPLEFCELFYKTKALKSDTGIKIHASFFEPPKSRIRNGTQIEKRHSNDLKDV